MANKRVSELNELLTAQVAADDLLLIADMSAVESKKITVANFKNYASSNGIYSGSFYGTASWARNVLTASHLLYNGIYNGSCSYAISASYALSASFSRWATSASYAISSSWALSSSYALSSSHAITASYAMVSEVYLVASSALADNADTASYLLYVAGFNNGTASAAISASWAAKSARTDFLNYTAGTPNGTASWAMSGSNTTSASYLYYNGTFNGTASHAIRAGTCLLADTASTCQSTVNNNIYREFSAITSDIEATNTASFGWFQLSGSGGALKMSIEAWGDVLVPITDDVNNSGSVELVIESDYTNSSLDEATYINYFTGSSRQDTGSIIRSFVLKGQFSVVPDPQRISASVRAYNGLTFFTGSRAVKTVVRATSDYFLEEV